MPRSQDLKNTPGTTKVKIRSQTTVKCKQSYINTMPSTLPFRGNEENPQVSLGDHSSFVDEEKVFLENLQEPFSTQAGTAPNRKPKLWLFKWSMKPASPITWSNGNICIPRGALSAKFPGSKTKGEIEREVRPRKRRDCSTCVTKHN